MTPFAQDSEVDLRLRTATYVSLPVLQPENHDPALGKTVPAQIVMDFGQRGVSPVCPQEGLH